VVGFVVFVWWVCFFFFFFFFQNTHTPRKHWFYLVPFFKERVFL